MGKGGVSPDYFKYKMTISEAALYLDGLNMRDRTAWCTARWLGWIVSRVTGGEAKSPEDMVEFPWEREAEMTEDEKTEMYDSMMEMLNAEKQRV